VSKKAVLSIEASCSFVMRKMLPRRKTTIVVAIAAISLVLIAISTFVFPMSVLSRLWQTSHQTEPFYILLTDPPTVPQGTTYLNLTYISIAVHIVDANGNSQWMQLNQSGTVNLLRLYNSNMSVVLGMFNIPINSTVDEISLSIASVIIGINGSSYNVTPLTSLLTINVGNSPISSANKAILDLSTTIAEIDGAGSQPLYLAMVPNAVAVVQLGSDSLHTGEEVKLTAAEQQDLKEVEESQPNVAITNASISVNGNVTSITVTVKNEGDANATMFGIVIRGQFNVLLLSNMCNFTNPQDNSSGTVPCMVNNNDIGIERPDSLIFTVNTATNTLVPMFGEPEEHTIGSGSTLILKPGESVNLTFDGTVELTHSPAVIENPSLASMPSIIITPIVGNPYEIQVMGEGHQIIEVIAT
jgi:hypothetical protein